MQHEHPATVIISGSCSSGGLLFVWITLIKLTKIVRKDAIFPPPQPPSWPIKIKLQNRLSKDWRTFDTWSSMDQSQTSELWVYTSKTYCFFLFRLSRSSIPQKKTKKQLQHKSMYAIIYFNGSSCANVLFVLIQISNCKLIWKRFNISIKLFIINHKVWLW